MLYQWLGRLLNFALKSGGEMFLKMNDSQTLLSLSLTINKK